MNINNYHTRRSLPPAAHSATWHDPGHLLVCHTVDFPCENVAFMDKDGARPGLTQEGCFLIGAGDQQCPLCFAELWSPVCGRSVLDPSHSAVLRQSGSQPQLAWPSHKLRKLLYGWGYPENRARNGVWWLVRETGFACVLGLKKNFCRGLPVGCRGSTQAGSS